MSPSTPSHGSTERRWTIRSGPRVFGGQGAAHGPETDSIAVVPASQLDQVREERDEMARSSGAALIAAERKRQVEDEGWTPEHDDSHGLSEPKSIAFCPCGNLSVDGLNFRRLEDSTLECAACGAVSVAFEYVRRSEVLNELLDHAIAPELLEFVQTQERERMRPLSRGSEVIEDFSQALAKADARTKDLEAALERIRVQAVHGRSPRDIAADALRGVVA